MNGCKRAAERSRIGKRRFGFVDAKAKIKKSFSFSCCVHATKRGAMKSKDNNQKMIMRRTSLREEEFYALCDIKRNYHEVLRIENRWNMEHPLDK